MVNDPKFYGLPHNEWRLGQKDAFQKALKILEGGGGNLVIEAPTGTGKSGIPTALGKENMVCVLVHNHGLLKQYEQLYGFNIIMGKQEYPCVLKSKVRDWLDSYGFEPTAADCHFPNMYDCPVASNCPYIIARDKAFASGRMACTYKYATLSEQVKDRTGIVVMDEAHDAYEELIEFSKFVIDERARKEFNFPDFPLKGFGINSNGDILEGANRSKVKDWLASCINKISVKDLFLELTQQGSKNQKMGNQLSSAIGMIESGQPLFYKCRVPESEDWRTFDVKRYLTMEIRSLDVKHLVRDLTRIKDLSVFMSATIGNPKPLLGELGISDYVFERYPHPVPKDKRPIYDLHVERMTKSNLDSMPGLYKIQADKIANFILKQDKTWRAIVLTSSNYKVNTLRKFMREKLNGRIIIPKDGDGLKAQIDFFMNKSSPGAISVATIQGWGSGISLDYEKARIAVVAGVAFSNPGDRFDQLRMSTATGKSYAFWNAYCGVVQATGRVSRGEIDDNGSYMLNMAVLADGSTTTPMAYDNYPKWFTEAIVK